MTAMDVSEQGRTSRTRRARAGRSFGARLGVVVALAAHAAALVVASRIEIDATARVARADVDAEEPTFTLDLRAWSSLEDERSDALAAASPAVDDGPTEPAAETAPPEALEVVPTTLVALAEPDPIPAPPPIEPLDPPAPDAIVAPLAVPNETPRDARVVDATVPEVGGGPPPSGASPRGPPPTNGDEPARGERTEPRAASASEKSSSAKASTPASVGGSSPSAATDVVRDARDLHVLASPAPEYPRAARRAGRAGSVTCRLIVERDGRVLSVEIVASSGHADLDAAALAALRRWRFASIAELTDAPRVSVLQRLEFRLEPRSR